jgi:hypothetical protein
MFKTAVTPVDPGHSVFQVKKNFIQFLMHEINEILHFFKFKVDEEVGKDFKQHCLRFRGQFVLLYIIPVHCENDMKRTVKYTGRGYSSEWYVTKPSAIKH